LARAASVILQLRLNMTIVVKERDPLVVPLNIRRRAGIKPGDRLEFKAARGVITIVSRSQIADGETPEQRRIIDAQLVEGLEDFRRGRVSARFDTVEDMLESLKGSSPNKPRKAVGAAKSRRREKNPS
jgi:bifunctional DNA-binding transcriptional regulator/antitoxin component of YhaV-PrlF toxin-antitoxin module